MNKIMANLQRFGRIRQLHTIISQETIRPSSPTPPNLKIHDLSLLDQFAPDMHTHFVFFYPNYRNGDTNILKKSLSHSLTQYYPFAGRIIQAQPSATHINCNDEGVEFFEASNNGELHDFIQKNEQDATMDELFPYGLSYSTRTSSPKLLDVQLNHFSGGGAAVALSMSHKLADAATIANFINHWATVTRGGSPLNPFFNSSSSSSSSKIEMPELIVKDIDKVKYATRRFIFPNPKLNELKNKVSASAINTTRVEVLTSLLYKHAVKAATMNSGSSKPSTLSVAMNMRNKFVEKYPETAVGSIFSWAMVKLADSGEIRLGELIGKVRKAKMELEEMRDEQQVVEKFANAASTIEGDVYYSSSLCRVPFYEVDFGWGKPVEVTMRISDVEEKTVVLMDTPSGDGITALVRLPDQEIAILQKDQEFLTYVQEV